MQSRIYTLLFTVFVILFSTTTAFAAPPQPTPTQPDNTNPNDPFRRSDSPYLRLSADWLNLPAILPPAADEVDSTTPVADPTAVALHNLTTGETMQIPSSDLSQQRVAEVDQSSEPFNGLLPAGSELLEPDSVIGTDGRSRVGNTTNFPWRSLVKLNITFPNGATGGCSGAIVGSPQGHGFHVLTAGHCVHSAARGGWASSIEVIPGLDDGYLPYNRAWATFLRSYTGWTNDQDSRHDWGLITLDRNIGDFTGWMGRRTAPATSSIYTGVLNTAGYPSDLCSGQCMYYDGDTGHSADITNHWYSMDTMPGQSGSPVWRYANGSRYILTVHTCGTGGCGITGNSVNHGTRLNNNKYNRLITWMNADIVPVDRPDVIDDGEAFSGFDPVTVLPGTSHFYVQNDVRNVGTATAGAFKVSYYASTNAIISSNDYLIGSTIVGPVAPLTWIDAGWSGTFPSNIPPGTYWVGWIIDSDNNLVEFDESNNSAYKMAYQLTVNNFDTLPDTATLIAPAGIVDTNTPAFVWNRVFNATWYMVWVNDGAGNVYQQWYTSSDICGESACWVTPANLRLVNGAHRFWVQTWNSNGYGSWSAPLDFSVPDGTPGQTTLLGPWGSVATHTPAFAWQRVSGASWYRLWVDGAAGNVVDQWYPADGLCVELTCSVTPDGLYLADGDYRFWVQTWNSFGVGSWSTLLDFTVYVVSQGPASGLGLQREMPPADGQVPDVGQLGLIREPLATPGLETAVPTTSPIAPPPMPQPVDDSLDHS